MKYKLDKDLRKLSLIKTPMCRLLFPLSSLLLGLCSFKRKRGIKIERETIDNEDETSFNVTLLTPLGVKNGLPIILYLHGGAYVYKAAIHHYRLMEEYCMKSPCSLLFVDYSLSPGKKYPTAVEEAVRAYRWAREELRADRIAIMGDSAGGEIALSAVMRLIDENLPRPSFLSLIYPVVAPLDTPSKQRFVDTPIWNARLNRRMWKYYIDAIPYTSVFDYPQLSQFPPLYIETAAFDSLHDEGCMLSSLLRAKGVSVVHNDVDGAPHGFDIAQSASLTKRMVEKRIMYIKEHFEENK